MSEIKAWANTVGQQVEKMSVDLVAQTSAGISEASGDVFFVGRPAQNGQDWVLKKITPTELEKMVYNYLTTSSVAQQLASVLGAPMGLSNRNDLDPTTVEENCVFRFSNNRNGYFPTSIGDWGYCLVMCADKTFKFIIALSDGHLYTRAFWGRWFQWYEY